MTRNETERQGDKSGKTASLPDTKHLAVPLSPCIQVVALVLFLPSTAGGVQLVLPKTADIPKEKVRNTWPLGAGSVETNLLKTPFRYWAELRQCFYDGLKDGWTGQCISETVQTVTTITYVGSIVHKDLYSLKVFANSHILPFYTVPDFKHAKRPADWPKVICPDWWQSYQSSVEQRHQMIKTQLLCQISHNIFYLVKVRNSLTMLQGIWST